MNCSKYGTYLNQYYGVTTCRSKENMYVMDFQDFPFSPWEVNRLHHARHISSDPSCFPFLHALKIFFKTEAPCSVFCKQDTWTVLVGKERAILPMALEDSATFQLYVTPYYVEDPRIVSQHLRGSGALSAYDHVFRYGNSILFLDGNAIPAPGACYFDRPDSDAFVLHRICILTREPVEAVVAMANAWKTKRGIDTLPFVSRSMVALPAMIHFQPVTEFYFPDQSILSSHTVQKRLSLEKPRCLIQDILSSHVRHHLRSLEGPDSPSVAAETNPLDCLNNVGLVIEFPFRITYEGSKPVDGTQKRFVALAVNGLRPTRILHVRHPYERYVEYDEVPATFWTHMSYVQTTLEVPREMEKVSVYGTVIGVVYKKSFFCFNIPLLEGVPSPSESRNVDKLLSIGNANNLFHDDGNALFVSETFELTPQYEIHHVHLPAIKRDAWCITKVTPHSHSAFPKHRHPSPLLHAWIQLWTQHKDLKLSEVVDTEFVRLALVLTRHRICFKTRIEDTKQSSLEVSDSDITLVMGSKAIQFLNEVRVQDTVLEDKEKSSICTVM